jgi:hypothetical protein
MEPDVFEVLAGIKFKNLLEAEGLDAYVDFPGLRFFAGSPTSFPMVTVAALCLLLEHGIPMFIFQLLSPAQRDFQTVTKIVGKRDPRLQRGPRVLDDAIGGIQRTRSRAAPPMSISRANPTPSAHREAAPREDAEPVKIDFHPPRCCHPLTDSACVLQAVQGLP